MRFQLVALCHERLPTRFSPSKLHTTTFICCSLACKPPKAALYRSCIVTYDVIYCTRDKCGRANKRGKRKAILVTAVRALCALWLVKMCSTVFKQLKCDQHQIKIPSLAFFSSLSVWLLRPHHWQRVLYHRRSQGGKGGLQPRPVCECVCVCV